MNRQNYIQEIFEKINYVRKFSKGDIIYHQGDNALSFYYLKKGRVRVYMTSPDGVEHTLSTANKGEILGEAAFFDKMPRISSAYALTDIEVAVIGEDMFIDLTRKHPRLALELLGMQAARVRQLSTQIDAMTFMKADGRIAQLLISNADKNGIVHLTHEEIAEATGVTRVTVSKTLSMLREKKALKTEYKRIVVLDINSLKRLVDE